MFTALKKLIFGDTRPIRRSVIHPALGNLLYSDEYEAWLSDPKSSPCGFGFCIAGDWNIPGPEVLPPQPLMDAAINIASHSESFVRSVRNVIDSKLKAISPKDPDLEEIKNLRVHYVALMWPDKPNEGEIELRTSPDSDRMWFCGYINGEPVLPLEFAGLDN